jgi:hypothetical protein
MALGEGGTSPQPRRVRPVGGTPTGKIVGIAAAIMLTVILLVIIVNAIVGDGATTPTSVPQGGNDTTPHSLNVDEATYRQLRDSYHASVAPAYREAYNMDPRPTLFSVTFEGVVERVEAEGRTSWEHYLILTVRG